MKTVQMYVWNTFENDARVMRECTALSENGYDVHLVCLMDENEKLKKIEHPVPYFTVRRLKRGNLKKTLFSLYFIFLLLLCIGWLKLASTILLMSLLFHNRKCWAIVNKVYLIMKMTLVNLFQTSDIYHANDINTLPQTIINAKIFRRKKLIYDSHEIQISRTGYNSILYYFLEKYFLKYVDTYIHENDKRAHFVEKVYGIKPKVIHNYPICYDVNHINKVNLHELLAIDESEPILLYQGGIQQDRGLENLIQAVSLLEQGTLVLIGDGRLKQTLLTLTEQLNLTDRVKFLDKVYMDNLKCYTVSATIGLQVLQNTCMNHYLASSNKLFEYIMAEVPIVACSFPEIAKVVEAWDVGEIVDSHNVQSIRLGIERLLNNNERHQTCKINCRNAKMVYNWEQEKNKFLKLYVN
ncbi:MULTISPECIES: glycosyltransferase [Enterococcus]|uniref:glycosyltransferase n=1 Tax=Enterococcus TaxID=1350 RepID=UPI0007C179CB|nr:glycosyltransferase [Enterococcus hirae]AND73250.1 glycosyl transferase [Enterococcus hirae]